MNSAEEGAAPLINANFMMPWFMGAAWIPKYNGDSAKFVEWRAQVEAMLRAQGLNNQQQADFVLGALEGEPKRELMLAKPTEKDTGVKVLDFLQNLYAKPPTKAQLRSNFFNCKQQTQEPINAFILRLREVFSRWQDLDDDREEEEDGDLLLDQFMVGLCKGPIKQELSRQMRRRENMTFRTACKEARALEKELQDEDDTFVSNRIAAYAAPKPSVGNPDKLKEQIHSELKEELLGEMKREIREQLKSISSAIVEDIRTQLQVPTPSPPPQSRRPRPETPSFQWDERGRPICKSCGGAGHIQRYCPQRPARGKDF